MHSHFNYTFMYILPQFGRPTSAPAHWLTGLSALCPATPSFTLLLLSVHHICIVTLTISTCTYSNQPYKPVSVCTLLLYIASLFTVVLFLYLPIVHLIPSLHYWLEPVSKHFNVVFGIRDK
jgi:hypothetical protein